MALEPEQERPLDEDEGGPVKSFLEHLEDLRWVLIKSISTIAVAMLICLIGGNYVVAILKRPLEKAQARYGGDQKVVVFEYGTNRLNTFRADLDQWDALNVAPDRPKPWLLASNEIVDVKSLAKIFAAPEKDGSDTREISKFIAEHLSPDTRVLITNYIKWPGLRAFLFPNAAEAAATETMRTNLEQAMLNDLNRMIEGGAIYDAQRFAGIHAKLAPGTLRLIAQNAQGNDLFLLNRRLLLHTYPEEITSGGQRFVVVQLEPQSNGTNLVMGMRVEKGPEAEAIAKKIQVDLNTLSPAGGFFVAFQVALYAGIAVSSPFLFYYIAQFVFPALKWREKRYVYRGMFFFVPLFVIGASFCYFALLPVALAASQVYSNWLGLSADIWQAEEYISFVSKFVLGMGLGFEMPVVILVLVKIGILNYSILSKGRRYMILINLVLGALLTTPEVLTQVLMAVPLQLLYEISVWVAWYWEWKEKRREAAAQKIEREM